MIAPHPDDEALGCGGLMAALASGGRSIQTIFLTDGAGSHPRSRAWPTSRLRDQRKREATEALSRLGCDRQPRAFLDLPDTAAPRPDEAGGDAATGALAGLLTRFAPELVLAPWRRDPHCDHRAAWALVHEALDRTDLTPEVLEYAVWLDELGTDGDRPRPGEAEAVAFDIRPVLHLKRWAVAAHLSQTTNLIDDDPEGFRLSTETIERLVGETEVYWRTAR